MSRSPQNGRNASKNSGGGMGFGLTNIGSKSNLLSTAQKIFGSRKFTLRKGNASGRHQASPGPDDHDDDNIDDQDMQQHSPSGQNFNTIQHKTNKFQSNIPGTKTSTSGLAYYPSSQSQSPKTQQDLGKLGGSGRISHKSKPSMQSSANLGAGTTPTNDPQQKKVYKFPLNNQKGSNSANNSQSRDQGDVQPNRMPGSYGSQSAQNLPKVSFGQGTKMNMLNRQSHSPQNVSNNGPNAIGSKKYVSTQSPGGGQQIGSSLGYNNKLKANSPNNYISQQQAQMQKQGINTSQMSNQNAQQLGHKKQLFSQRDSKLGNPGSGSQGGQSGSNSRTGFGVGGNKFAPSGNRSGIGSGQNQQISMTQSNQFKKTRNSAQAQIFGMQKGTTTPDGQDSEGRPSLKNSSPKNNFIGQGNQGRINQKLGPVSSTNAKKYSAGGGPISNKGVPNLSKNYQRYTNQISGGQSQLGESRNSKQNLYTQKNVTNPIQTKGLGLGPDSGRQKITTGTKSPMNYRRNFNDGNEFTDAQDNIDMDVGNDDYDEETDEFADYCKQSHMQHIGEGINNQPSNMGMPPGSSEGGPMQSQTTGDQTNTNDNQMNQSIKSSSSKGKKSQAQKDREKNIREIKMYYWTKVDQGDRTEVVKILTFAKANFNHDNEMFEIVNCTNSDGFTPLHLASSEGHAPLIETLIRFGAQVDARTNNFRTPLHIACLRGNLSVIQALIQHGADINAKDIDSNTPCHFCSEYGHRFCLKFLLTRNPYLFANNNEDKSAIDVAISSEILNEFQEFITKSKDFQTKKKAGQGQTTKPNEAQTNTGSLSHNKIEAPPNNEFKKMNSDQNSSNIDSQHSDGGISSSRGANLSSSRNQNNSRLSNNTRIVNKVAAVQKQMNQRNKEEESDRKVTQIKIHGANQGMQRKMPNMPAKTSKQIMTEKREEEKRERSKGPESTSNGLSRNMNIQSSKSNQIPKGNRSLSPGVPSVQDVDRVDDSQYFRHYGQEHFEPLKKLGSGSFGDVFLVRDKNSGKLYAMKTLSKRKILGQNLVRYAKTERDVLSYMRHPFIVNLHYAFQSKTKLFLILEFCPGGDLGKIIAHERRFTEDRARLYIAEVLLALHDLHKRDIIYRDLKPDNVVLDDDGHALLTDFGLSKEGVLEVSKGAKSFCGSIAYLAPEMLRRVGHGKSVDWYLLGVLLYEMLVGTPPYFSGNKDELFNNIMNGPLKLPRSISTEAKNLMVSLLNRNPTKRLGAGPEGALEIQRHPFFASINWSDVLAKRTRPPKPRLRTEHFNKQYPYSEFSRKQIQDIFDDEKEINMDTKDNVGTQNVDGWSFVKQTESHLEIFENMKKDHENETEGSHTEGHVDNHGNFSVAGNTQNPGTITTSTSNNANTNVASN